MTNDELLENYRDHQKRWRLAFWLARGTSYRNEKTTVKQDVGDFSKFMAIGDKLWESEQDVKLEYLLKWAADEIKRITGREWWEPLDAGKAM